MLGEIVGIDDTLGIVGGAPKANASVISYFDPAADEKKNPSARVADRVMVSTLLLALGTIGDVLVLEVQFSGMVQGRKTLVPVDTDPIVFEAIRLATKVGVIVVEAAGNGNANLDEFRDRKGKKILLRGGPDFKESGAIMVGGCSSSVPHARWIEPLEGGSNFGSRVDCFAWAENIVTCAWDSNNPAQKNNYFGVGANATTFFKGTSGATPIIAVCCLLMQNLHSTLTPKTGSPGRLRPLNMRQILTNPLNGTQSSPNAKIGVMPDFKKIIANEFAP